MYKKSAMYNVVQKQNLGFVTLEGDGERAQTELILPSKSAFRPSVCPCVRPSGEKKFSMIERSDQFFFFFHLLLLAKLTRESEQKKTIFFLQTHFFLSLFFNSLFFWGAKVATAGPGGRRPPPEVGGAKRS
jgi:hypothetical protein